MESRDGVPLGFGGYVDTLAELTPDGAKTLRLPEDGVVDGPFVRIPDGQFDVIVISNLAESLGRLEGLLAEAAAHLNPGGTLLVDMENLAAPRSLKFVLEGRPGNLDPFGSLGDPERRVHKPRVLRALESAGLLVEETSLVPSRSDYVGPEFLRTMFRQGFLALPYLAGLPPARVWIRASLVPALAGTVVLAESPGVSSEATERSLQAALPADWEVLRVDAGLAGGEPEAFNQAIVRSRGEVLWFLRAGTNFAPALLQDLWDRSSISPTAPGDGMEIQQPGDFNGLMIRRTDLFTVGPLSRRLECPQIAFEDWLLQLEATGKAMHGVPGEFGAAPLPAPETETFARESKALLAKWGELGIDSSGFVSADNPMSRAHADRVVPWAGRAPRLSLCMITRDEEHFLPQCLASAAPIVDEIIVVDTGSTDRTVEIAESFGAKVLHHEWTDDFAAARNVAREAATGDWILSLDADEALRPAQHATLRVALEDPGISGYHLKFKNHHTAANTVGVIMIRVFRNLPGVVWENRIHEQMTTSLVKSGNAEGLQLGITDVVVDHYGYLDEVMERRGKTERNDRIFRAHLDEQPDDIYMLYKYGDFLRRTGGRWQESLDMLRRSFDLILGLAPVHRAEIPYAAEIAALAALEYRRAGDEAMAHFIIQTALREFVCTPNLHYLAAGTALLRNASDEAIAHFHRCLAFRDQVLVVPVQEGITGHVSLTGIAQALMQKGELKKAQRLLEQSLRIEPSYEVSVLMLSRLCLDRGDLRGALTTLTSFLDQYPDSPGVCQQAALFMKELGYQREADAMTNRAIVLLEGQCLDFEANQLKQTVSAQV